ncbi:MAG: hypothetical protein ACREOY_05035 [Candidatus Dormibacteraceae bacterium]
MTGELEDLRRKIKSAYEFETDHPYPALMAAISAELKRDPRSSSRMGWMAGATAAALTVLVVVGLGGFHGIRNVGSPLPAAPSPAPSTEAGVAAILANNHLVYIPPGAATPTWDVAVAPAPDLNPSHGYAALGHRVAASAYGSVIYALPAKDFFGGDKLVVADSATGRVIREVQLPNPGNSARYGALAVGPSGDVWVVGSIGPVPSAKDLPVKHIEIVRVNHLDWSTSSWLGRSMSQWVAQDPVGGDFEIYEVQLTSDEGRIYYSYTGGLDWVDISGNRATTCTPPDPNQACAPGLAGFLVHGSSIYITTANDPPSGAIDYYDLDGTLRGHIQLGLLPGFLEDFVLAPDGHTLYLFGSCGYSGGMAKLDITTNKPSVIVKAGSQYTHPANPPCGQSSAFVAANLIAVGHVGALLPSDAEGTILYVDAASGSIRRSVVVSAEPIAIASVELASS